MTNEQYYLEVFDYINGKLKKIDRMKEEILREEKHIRKFLNDHIEHNMKRLSNIQTQESPHIPKDPTPHEER